MSAEEELHTLLGVLVKLDQRLQQLQEEQVSTTQALIQLIVMQRASPRVAGVGPTRPLSDEEVAALDDIFEGFTEWYQTREGTNGAGVHDLLTS